MISPGVFFIFKKFWFFGSFDKRVKNSPKWKNYIHHVPYLRNNIAMIMIFGTLVKWWYLQMLFSFFQNFDFLGSWLCKRAKNAPKWQKFCLLPSIYQEPYIIRLSSLVHMCEMIISPSIFFHFFKILIFCAVTGVKLQKVQDDKKFCRSCSMSQ